MSPTQLKQAQERLKRNAGTYGQDMDLWIRTHADELLRLALLGAQIEELFAGRNTDVTQPLPPARQLPHKGYTRAQGEEEDRARAAP